MNRSVSSVEVTSISAAGFRRLQSNEQSEPQPPPPSAGEDRLTQPAKDVINTFLAIDHLRFAIDSDVD